MLPVVLLLFCDNPDPLFQEGDLGGLPRGRVGRRRRFRAELVRHRLGGSPRGRVGRRRRFLAGLVWRRVRRRALGGRPPPVPTQDQRLCVFPVRLLLVLRRLGGRAPPG